MKIVKIKKIYIHELENLYENINQELFDFKGGSPISVNKIKNYLIQKGWVKKGFISCNPTLPPSASIWRIELDSDYYEIKLPEHTSILGYSRMMNDVFYELSDAEKRNKFFIALEISQKIDEIIDKLKRENEMEDLWRTRMKRNL